VLVLAMLHARQDLAFCRSITFQLIGDNHTWNVLELFEELPKKAFRLCWLLGISVLKGSPSSPDTARL
jgi:hypothetical protein